MNTAMHSEFISKVGKRRQVVIPKAVAENLNLREGDFIAIFQTKKGLILEPKKLVNAEEVLTPAEEKKVAQGFRQLKRGEYETWDKIKHELGL